MLRVSLLALVSSAFFPAPTAAQPKLQIAEFGECLLESGEVLQDCRVGYRTFGELDATRSNAVLFTTGLGGTSENLAEDIGPEGWVDDAKHFVIAVDAFGNSVSSSPSNSAVQPDSAFPQIAIRDMVASQHRLVTEVLGLSSLHAVIGASMGGAQAFEWAVSYPGFAKKVISIEGSPRTSAYNLVLWQTVLQILDLHEQCQCREAVSVFGNLLFILMGRSPVYHDRMTPRDSVPRILERMADIPLSPWKPNLRAQVVAGLNHNVAAPYGDSLERAAARVQAEVLVIVTPMDHLVTPGPSLEFAKLLGAETLVLSSDCGHLGLECDYHEISEATRRVLARQD
ncbi:MAG: alpha/beta fold hydrolase [Gemmatimonadales bacterium]